MCFCESARMKGTMEVFCVFIFESIFFFEIVNQAGSKAYNSFLILTQWGGVTHLYVGYITIIGSDNGLWPGRRQVIIWTKAGILLIVPLGTNFSEILIEIQTFLFKKMFLKVSSAKWLPFCLGLNVLMIINSFALI